MDERTYLLSTQVPRSIKPESPCPCTVLTPPARAVPAELPPDVLGEIFQHLDTNDLLRCALVCREWQELVRQDDLWSARLGQNVARFKPQHVSAFGYLLELGREREQRHQEQQRLLRRVRRYQRVQEAYAPVSAERGVSVTAARVMVGAWGWCGRGFCLRIQQFLRMCAPLMGIDVGRWSRRWRSCGAHGLSSPHTR